MSKEHRNRESSNYEEYYGRLHSECGDVLAASLHPDYRCFYSASHNHISDLEKWVNAISSRSEVALLRLAIREYESALFALVQGHYRYSFTALRLFLELALGAIHFSTSELELQLWLRGQRGINWKPLVSPEFGIFSERFVGAFHRALAEEAAYYCALTEHVYDACSKYVHGELRTYQLLPERPEFVEECFLDWHDKARSAVLVVSFALCARYLNCFDEKAQRGLKPMIIDQSEHTGLESK